MTPVLDLLVRQKYKSLCVFNAQFTFLDTSIPNFLKGNIFALQNGTSNWTDDRCAINITLVLTLNGHLSFLSMLFRRHYVRCINNN